MKVETPDNTANDLVRVIGEDKALKLMTAYPKVMLEIPRNPEKAPCLQQVVGYSATVKLCEYYHGDYIYIPSAENILRAYRDKKIRQERGKKSVDTLAREHGLSYRRIQQIQARKKPQNDA